MPYISYDPNKPGDRERAAAGCFIGPIIILGSVASIVFYFCSLISLFKGDPTPNLIYSVSSLLVLSFIDISYISSNSESIKKGYFIIFYGVVLELTGIVAIIMAIISIYQNSTGMLLLICSLFGVVVVALITILLYRKNIGSSVKLFSDKDLLLDLDDNQTSSCESTNGDSPTAACTDAFYCHKCGKKLPFDSNFCSACGAKIK